MATEALADLRTSLEALFQHGRLGSLTDGELLERFLTGDESSAEAVFTVLVDRHAPMVLRVCRSVLGSGHDAEDAAQAVFLVLARRAGSVRRRDSAASWLYGVARRISARDRRDAARRRKHERRRAEMAVVEVRESMDVEAHEELYEEIDRLPEIYRSALVLCYLEGMSHEQAARWLGCPLRTLQSRLLRAKERLRDRLVRRGLGVPAVFPPLAKSIATSPGWAATTVKAAKVYAASRAPFATIGVSAAVLTLAKTSLRGTLLAPKLCLALFLSLSLGTLGVVAGRGGFGSGPPVAPLKPAVPQAVAPAHDDPNNRTLILRVIDRDSGAPIAGAEVTVETDSGARPGLGDEPILIARLTTDKAGRCTIEFPRVLPKIIAIGCQRAGYVNGGYGPLVESAGGTIPGEHTIEMERGITIGGVVKSRDGKPVAGAKVIVMATAPDRTHGVQLKATTDAQGRWRSDEMPRGWGDARVCVTHPDYVSTLIERDVRISSAFDLKARRAETVLDEGVALAGRVLDDQGRPLAGAAVALGSDRRIGNPGYPTISTDAQGRFRFGHIPEGTQTVTVQAPGHAPALADVVVAPGMKPVEFRLGPGHLLRGRVVNKEGKPLDGVTVQAMDWKGHMSLDWTTKTSADGRFSWKSAPTEPILLTLTRPGFVMLGQREFQADKPEKTLTMYPPLRVRGRVTDARTGRAIQEFTVVSGAYYRPWNGRPAARDAYWDRRAPWQALGGGNYEIECSHPLVAAVAVRIEAGGYKPDTSEPFKMEAGDVRFDAKLEAGLGPSGVVFGPDHRPLAGATVILSTKSLRVQLGNGTFPEGAYPQVVTGADGRFRFPAQTEAYRVFVDHEKGFAEADEKTLASSPPLTIQPWGRVEGIVKIGAHPAKGVQIRLSETDNRWNPDVAMPITQAQQLATDSRGHYAFERVIPARLSVSRIFALERSGFHVGTGAIRIVTVKPGVTTWVDLGGTGRPVIGRFVPPAGTKSGAVFRSSSDQSLELIRPDPPYPPILSGKEREEWLAEWLKTEEGQAYSNVECRFDTNVRADGTFRVEDVPAGKYRLQAYLHEPGNGVPGTYGRELANIDTEITVPEMPGGRSDEPLDLGTIELKPVKRQR
ncbi:MAG: sigma-70 family RNA polymerase sigma factor [Isosphaeraceae bacterium]